MLNLIKGDYWALLEVHAVLSAILAPTESIYGSYVLRNKYNLKWSSIFLWYFAFWLNFSY